MHAIHKHDVAYVTCRAKSTMHQNGAELHHNGAKCTKTELLSWHDSCSMRTTIICNWSLSCWYHWTKSAGQQKRQSWHGMCIVFDVPILASSSEKHIMQIEQIITALHNAKLYEAAKLQCGFTNIDNLKMLVAIATGKVATIKELFAVYTYTWE